MYSFNGWHQLVNDKNEPSPLWKQIYDDIWRCLHCGNRKVPIHISPEYSLVSSTTPREEELTCNVCGKRLAHLENRMYGLNPGQIRSMGRIPISHPIWGRKMPLWSINKD